MGGGVRGMGEGHGEWVLYADSIRECCKNAYGNSLCM